MSRLIKVIDNETIEIAEYRCPEVIFKNSQNPPTLQDTKNEIEHLEWYCTFKDTINPFQMYAENERLEEELKYTIPIVEHNQTIQSNINSYNKLAKYSEELEDRIDKAIEYIEDNSDDMHTYISQVLTDILKGSE